MEEVTTLGVDLAKNVFSLHGVDAAGKPVLRRTVRRDRLVQTVASLSPCLIGMEACSGAGASCTRRSKCAMSIARPCSSAHHGGAPGLSIDERHLAEQRVARVPPTIMLAGPSMRMHMKSGVSPA
jgi:hypothetical protein